MNPEQLISWVNAAKEGNQDAFGAVYDLYYDKIFAFSFRRTLHHHASEDIVSNVFLKVFHNLKKFEWHHPGSFNGWIYKIASNEINTYFRKEAKYQANIELPKNFEEMHGDEGGQAYAIEHQLVNDANFQHLKSGLQKLKLRYQELIHLHYFEGLSSKEISEALKMNESSVRVGIHRALKELETHLASDALYLQEARHE